MKINKIVDRFKNSELIIFKNDTWLKNQKHAGRCVASCLKNCGDVIKNKTPNLNVLDLVSICERQFDLYECEPTFHNFKGFPAKVCISVNEELVHGVPKNRILVDGDIIKVDLGATNLKNGNGEIADAARTFTYGQSHNKNHDVLIKTCFEALKVGINAAVIGKQIGAIGYAIHNYVKNTGFGLVTKYGGHGIDANHAHAFPFVSNKDNFNNGIHIEDGLSIAIEPQLTLKQDVSTRVLSDGWTVVTPSIGVHFEDSITIFNGEVHNITEIMHEEY